MWQNEWHRLNCRTRKPEAVTETSAEHSGSSPKPIKHASVHLCSHSLVIVNGRFFGSCIASVTERKSAHKCLSAIFFFFTGRNSWLRLGAGYFFMPESLMPHNKSPRPTANILRALSSSSSVSCFLVWHLYACLWYQQLTSSRVTWVHQQLRHLNTLSVWQTRKHTHTQLLDGSFLAFQCQPT